MAEFGRSCRYHVSIWPSMLLFPTKADCTYVTLYEKRRKTIFAVTHNRLSILLITVDSCCAFPRAHRQLDMFPPFFVNILVQGRVQTALFGEADWPASRSRRALAAYWMAQAQPKHVTHLLVVAELCLAWCSGLPGIVCLMQLKISSGMVSLQIW